MTSDRWRRIEEIYEAALQRAPSERRVFLESACGGDEMLRRDVERLITANDRAGDFLGVPAWEVAPEALLTHTMTGDRATSLLGRQVGHYSVLAPLGVGGMGEVYRAHDRKLNREVALKVLPDLFALNPDRLARFKREAHVLASLNHPNIAAIYGIEDAGDIKALVLELVEGPTLADRIARGRVPLEDALPIARQIAEALEAAHERGIVHRDLKPANVKVRTDGVVKVLDFGLARALEVESSGAVVTQSPTVASPIVTADGIIVGTPAYMAPEQARGKPADKRADLWAFGCVLYEMLTGRRAFAGQDTTETLAATIKDDPDWSALPNGTPPSIRRLLRRCLAKDLKGRLSDAAVARIEIEEAVREPSSDIAAAQTPTHRRERIIWATALAIVAALGVAAVWTTRPAPVASKMHWEITTPSTSDPVSFAISPDGQRIVFVAGSEGRNMLWLYRLDSGAAAPLAGTDGATAPFWSPDSRSVGFFSTIDNTLKRIDVDGRFLQVLGTFPLGTGGTWNQDGTILFAVLAGRGPIYRISSTGGEATPATRLESTEQTHQFPQFLSDGRHFLYHAPNVSPPAVFLGRLGGSEVRRLVDADSAAVYLPPGYLLFLRQRTLFAQAFDPARLVLAGDPFRVADGVASFVVAPAVSASTTGTLVYRTGSAAVLGLRPLVWFDRSGTKIGTVGNPDVGVRPSLSRDGRQVALYRSLGTSPPQIWRLALEGGGGPTRLTFNDAINLDPIWSPDGSRVVYASNVKGPLDLYMTSVDGTVTDELLLASPENEIPSDWSKDGRFVLFEVVGLPTFGFDIWAFAVDGSRSTSPKPVEGRKPFPVVATSVVERQGQFSPDSQWIAYQSNETGDFEIYIQRFPGPGDKQRISTNGGAQVRWRQDGKELFYIALDGQLMSVPIQYRPDGQLQPGVPVPLFATQVGGALSGLDRQQYVVSPDGQRFLMSTVTENQSPLQVILNWRP